MCALTRNLSKASICKARHWHNRCRQASRALAQHAISVHDKLKHDIRVGTHLWAWPFVLRQLLAATRPALPHVTTLLMLQMQRRALLAASVPLSAFWMRAVMLHAALCMAACTLCLMLYSCIAAGITLLSTHLFRHLRGHACQSESK